MIPIIIICYNNYKYVKNTVKQIETINKDYLQFVTILDNCSTCQATIHYLKTVECNVIHNTINEGPWINETKNSHIYSTLPDKFIVTDPDLYFNTNLPTNFIDILSGLSDKYSCYKIGFALDISDSNEMYNDGYIKLGENTFTIAQWESQWWNNQIIDEEYELYNAAIDTTFCLINKQHDTDLNIRVAGNFTAKHLPWYKNTQVYNVYENYLLNKNISEISTISKLVNNYIQNNYLQTQKNNEIFFVEKNGNENLHFWENIYVSWENPAFYILDKYFDKNKIFIEIGGWVGTTCMYACRKNKHVYCIEADPLSFQDLTRNCQNNCQHNYTLLNYAIFNIDNSVVKFGKNMFLPNSKMNDSTSQIHNDPMNCGESLLIKTITIKSIITNYNINPDEISLIKVDIEGGEEMILNDLYNIHILHYVPLYIRFHYCWWNDQNLDRFTFLTEKQKNIIRSNPFASLLFDLTEKML